MAALHIVHLYPKEMNLYGDTGNREILEWRLRKRGIEYKVSLIGVGDEIPADMDLLVGGGGQDAGQVSIQSDLAAKSDALHIAAEAGVPMLLVCGLYQLFGRNFVTHTGEEIAGIGILPLETVAGDARLIGNTIYSSPWGELVGYENHSGQTYLDDPSLSLGTVVKGAGNNGKDKTEGCLHKNIFGTYSHGPILAKNPRLADELLKRALKRRFGVSELPELDDTLEHQAATVAKSRPR